MLGAPLNQYIYPILYQLQSAILAIRDWVFTFINSIFSSNSNVAVLSPLKPLFVIGIAVSIIFVAIVLIKKVVWGR